MPESPCAAQLCQCQPCASYPDYVPVHLFFAEAITTTSHGQLEEVTVSDTSAPTIAIPGHPEIMITFAQLNEMVVNQGYVLSEIDRWKQVIAEKIARGMRTMYGKFIYQSTKLTVPEVPREVVLALLPEPTSTSAREIFWEIDTATLAAQILGPILAHSGMQTAGASRAIQRASEPVIYVIATMMGGVELRLKTVKYLQTTRHTLYINYTYILMDEMGELHPPKDTEGREMLLPDEEVTELRETVMQDALTFFEAGARLSPHWLRQLVEHEAADVTEAHLENLESIQNAPLVGQGRRRDEYMIDHILEEKRGKVKVLWSGYQPSWEVWRTEGEIGSPIATWEPRKMIKHKQQYKEWEAAGKPKTAAATS